MNVFLTLLLLMAAPVPITIDQVKAESNPEHRARAAVDFAVAAERSAETAFSGGDMKNVGALLNTMKESMEIARDSLIASKKTPGRDPGLYKYAEQRSREILVRLEDLERRMFSDDRDLMTAPKSSVQEIHDAWFEGIMGRKR
jgi:hypothetical protein